MLHHALFGFLRVSLVGGCNKVVPEKLFRRRIFRDTPAIGSSVSVLHIDEIRDADIPALFQPVIAHRLFESAERAFSTDSGASALRLFFSLVRSRRLSLCHALGAFRHKQDFHRGKNQLHIRHQPHGADVL